jgi:hypothetical protein
VDVDPGARASLPIACTLTPGEGVDRLDDWRRVGDRAGLGREAAPGRVTLRFRDAPGVEAELGRLVEAERECCAFLDWDVVPGENEWRVDIRGTDEALQSLPLGR